MMQRYQIIIIVILIFMLAGCISQTPVEPTATFLPTASQQVVASPTQTSTLLLTTTPMITLQPTLTPTATTTSTPKPVRNYQPLTIETNIPSDYQLEGSLVLIGITSDNHLFDLNNLRRIPLSNTDDGQVHLRLSSWAYISPDRSKLAYLERFSTTGTQQLRIVMPDGQRLSVSNWPDSWANSWDGNIISWLDNERLAFTEVYLSNGTVYVLNPFIGEWQEIVPSFPAETQNGEFYGAYPNSSDNPYAVYDPSLTRVVYSRCQRDQDQYTFELWDTNSQSVLWQRSMIRYDARPVWLPNGDRFAVIYNQLPEDSKIGYGNLYIVSDDGSEIELTDMVWGELSWSPDGRYIATWWRETLNIAEVEHRNLALSIVDVATREITIYPFSEGYSKASQFPIWSPDGRYVAVNNWLEISDLPEEIDTRVVIIDLVENRAFEIVQDAIVVGWMIQSP